MAHTVSIPVILGSGQGGLSLTAQVIDSTGANVGAGITSGFVEVSPGYYLWTGPIPDGHRGAVKFSAGAAFKALAEINPEEVEYPDAKTSSRAALADYTTARAAKLDNLDATVSGVPAAVWTATTRTLSAFA